MMLWPQAKPAQGSSTSTLAIPKMGAPPQTSASFGSTTHRSRGAGDGPGNVARGCNPYLQDGDQLGRRRRRRKGLHGEEGPELAGMLILQGCCAGSLAESPMEKRCHLAPLDGIAWTEHVVDRRVASGGHTGCSQHVDLGFEW